MKKSLFQSGVLLHGRRCRTQSAAFLRSFSVVLFLLPLLFAHTAYGDINAELVKAADAGYTAKVEQLLEQGADVNARNRHGETALFTAADGGHTETVKVLIAAGADVDAQTKDALTALMFAARQGHTETVKALIDAGADVDAQTKDGLTALMFAAAFGHTEIVQAVVDAGADVNAKLKTGRTALTLAAQASHIETVNILKQAGAQAGRSYAEWIGIFLVIVPVIIFGITLIFARATLMKIIEGRSNREQFFFVFALCIMAAIIMGVVRYFKFLPEITYISQLETTYISQLLIFIICSYFLITAGIKRLHDFDQSGWWYLFALVPIANVALLLTLLFTPSTNGENQYGQQSDAREYRVMRVILFGVIGLLVGGIGSTLVLWVIFVFEGAELNRYTMFWSFFFAVIPAAIIGLIVGLVVGGIKVNKAENESSNNEKPNT